MKTTKAKTIGEYIAKTPRPVAARLRIMRDIVKKAAPKAEEVISYGMPAFKLNGLLLYFAAHQHHIGLYPYTSTISHFKKDLSKYDHAKGSIQFPHDKPLPVALIRKMVKFRVMEKAKKTR